MENKFSRLIDILEEVKIFCELPDLDVSWSRYDTAQDLLIDLNTYIKRAKEFDETVIKEINSLFAPTGALQEISIDNGWSNEFIKIAEQFDKIIEGESNLHQQDDFYEDYDSIKLKYARWQRVFGWAIILYALSNLTFMLFLVFYLKFDIQFKSEIILFVFLNIIIFTFNVFLIIVGIKKIKKNRRNPID